MEATEPKTVSETAEWLGTSDSVEAEIDTVEAVDVEVETEETVEADEPVEAVEAEVDDVDAEVEDDTEQQETEEELELFTVKVDGEEVTATLDELKQSFSGQSYIQKQIYETAETRKEAEAIRAQTQEHFDALNNERQQLNNLVQHIKQNGIKQPVPVDPEMWTADPIGAAQAFGVYQKEQAEFEAVQNALMAQQAQASAAQEAASAAYLQEQQAILQSSIPEFSDPTQATQIHSELRAVGAEYGFDDNELSSITDARHIRVLYDAMKFRQHRAKTQEVTKKVSAARPVVKPKAKNPIAANVKADRDKHNKMKKSGSVKDVAEWL